MVGWTPVVKRQESYCVCVCLVVALKGMQVGFEAQGADVGQVGGSVQVQTRQDLHVPDPGRVELQEVFYPLGLVIQAVACLAVVRSVR